MKIRVFFFFFVGNFATWCVTNKNRASSCTLKEKKSHKSYYILWKKRELKLSYLDHTLLHVVSMYVRVSEKHPTFFFVFDVWRNLVKYSCG
jgi:hypothetical protein